MKNHYIARFRDESLAAIFVRNNTVMIKLNKNGRWENEQPLHKGSAIFSADFDKIGNLCLFAQDADNDIVLIAHNGNKFSARKLLKSPAELRYSMRVYSMQSSALVYNIPAEDNKFKLIRQTATKEGWESPTEITVFSPPPAIPSFLFEMQSLGPAHSLVFYNAENNLIGYREISPADICAFVPMQRHNETIVDYNFLTVKSGVHALFVSANMFRQRLMYTKKISAKLSEPVVLWEGPRIENCLLSEIKGEMWAFWSVGESLYVAKSKDGIFQKAAVYTQKFCKKPQKAFYISDTPSENYFTRAVYVDSEHPWDVQILPDIFSDFYPQSKAPEIPLPPPAEPENTDYEERLTLTLKHAKKLREENFRLKEEIEKLRKNGDHL